MDRQEVKYIYFYMKYNYIHMKYFWNEGIGKKKNMCYQLSLTCHYNIIKYAK